MSTPIIKIKVTPKSTVKGKMDVRFPSSVTVESPILLTRTGGNYGFSLDFATLVAELVANPAFAFVDREVNAAGAVTLLVTDDLVRINKTVSAATTANLPVAATYTKQSLMIKDQKGDATNYPISVTPNGTETIDGQTGARLIDWPYGGLRLRPVTGGWITLP